MKRTVVLSCFTGNGIVLLILLFFGIAAVPMPSSKPTQTIPDDITSTNSNIAADALTSVTSSTFTKTTTQSQHTLVPENANANSPQQEKDSPTIVNNENVTEAEIVITEVRHGKSLHQHDQPDVIAKNDTLTTESSSSNSTSSDFAVKLASEGNQTIQRIHEGDAPPIKVDSGDAPKGKLQEFENPRLVLAPLRTPVQTEQDKTIQRIFGGECGFAHWNRCSRIEFWGGDYLVPDKNNPGKFIVRNHKIKCRDGKNICLRNGWTIQRCHMLCMSQCNVEYRMNYEKLVLHEGDCRMPLLLK